MAYEFDPWMGVAAVVVAVVLVLVLRGRDTSIAPPQAGVAQATVVELMQAGRKIDAIKLYREQNHVGLKEAKEAVEALDRGEAP
jgi:ribosomal protein L7/L12